MYNVVSVRPLSAVTRIDEMFDQSISRKWKSRHFRPLVADGFQIYGNLEEVVFFTPFVSCYGVDAASHDNQYEERINSVSITPFYTTFACQVPMKGLK